MFSREGAKESNILATCGSSSTTDLVVPGRGRTSGRDWLLVKAPASVLCPGMDFNFSMPWTLGYAVEAIRKANVIL
jgi:hypothetical protein